MTVEIPEPLATDIEELYERTGKEFSFHAFVLYLILAGIKFEKSLHSEV